MEDFREAAVLYYKNTSEEVRNLAKKTFNSMDTDGDGRISSKEFENFVRENGGDYEADEFTELDRNGDGTLDFFEFLTMYYMSVNRVVCDQCNKWLHGLYFSCVACFRYEEDTFDLCSTCYRRGEFSHHHDQFLDNYAMLALIKPSPSDSPSDPQSGTKSDKVSRFLEIISAGQTVVDAGNAVVDAGSTAADFASAVAGCNIM